jgi:hypothetical protein
VFLVPENLKYKPTRVSFKIQRLFETFCAIKGLAICVRSKSRGKLFAKSTPVLVKMKKNKVGSIELNDDARQKILNPNQRQILEDNRRIHERMLQLAQGCVRKVEFIT